MNLKMVFICSINVCNKNIVIMARTFLFVLVISSLNSDAWVEDGLQSVIKSLKTNSSNFWHTSTVCVCVLLAVGNNCLWNPRWMRLDSHPITFATCFDNIARLNWTALITTLSSKGGLGSHKQGGTITYPTHQPFCELKHKSHKSQTLMTQVVEFTMCHFVYLQVKGNNMKYDISIARTYDKSVFIVAVDIKCVINSKNWYKGFSLLIEWSCIIPNIVLLTQLLLWGCNGYAWSVGYTPHA